MQAFSQAVAEVKSQIESQLKDGYDAEAFAEAIVWQGIETGDNGRGEMSGELSGYDTWRGNPVPVSFGAVDDAL